MRNFKKALINTGIFLLIVTLAALSLPIFYFEYSMKNWTATTDILERNIYSGKITTLFSGASHGLEAFVPAIYDEKLSSVSYNLCGTLQSMEGRYALLKEEIERNPVDTVILEVSFNSLSRSREDESAEGDLDVIRRLNSRSDKLKYAFKSLSLDEWAIAYYMTAHNGFSAIVEMFTSDTDAELQKSLTAKGYLEAESNDLSLSAEEYSLQHHTESVNEEIDPENMEYLNRIFELCKENDIQVIMVTIPLSDRMINRTDNLDVIRNYYVQIAAEQDCAYYDFNLWKDRKNILSDKTDFYDDLHMSALGAQKFSKALAELLAAENTHAAAEDYFYSSYAEIN